MTAILTFLMHSERRLILPILIPTLTAVVLTVSVVFFIIILRQQIRLHNSITLVELKSPKLIYWILFVLSVLTIIYFSVAIISPQPQMLEMFENAFGMEQALSMLVVACLLAIFVGLSLMLFMLAVSKCAVVDRGVYTKVFFFDWYHIHDYFVDEKKNMVTLSKNRHGPLSLAGMSPPLKYNKDDVEKIRFILNKNKNKFLVRYELR